jgi:hypothetical protein
MDILPTKRSQVASSIDSRSSWWTSRVRDSWNYIAEDQLFASRGATLHVNFRISGGFERIYEQVLNKLAVK